MTRATRGALAGGALLGEFAAISFTLLMVMPTIDLCFSDECGSGGGGDPASRAAAGQLVRPLLLGGFVSALGGRHGGRGRAEMAMLGTVPGSVLNVVGWSLFFSPKANDPAVATRAVVLVSVGHLASITGSVVGYRLSERRRPRLPRRLRSDVRPTLEWTDRSLTIGVVGTM